MTEQTIPAYDDEISLLDILVTLAESWRLLVLGPLVVGVIAGGLSFLWPKTFESVAIVRMTEEEVALLHAAPVLDPLIERFGLLAEANGIVDDARQDLKKRLTFAVDKKTKLAIITAKARTPDAAQALGSMAIAAALKELQVKGQEKDLLEKTIAINSRAIDTAEDAIESIQRSLKRAGATDQAQESAIKNLAAINADIVKLSSENEALRQKLEPKGAEVFVQEASLPQRKVSFKLGLVVALIAILVSGFALLIFIFTRKAWMSAAQEEGAMEKIALINKAFQFK
jgi:capsular polysaccharide biosynthesis protein